MAAARSRIGTTLRRARRAFLPTVRSVVACALALLMGGQVAIAAALPAPAPALRPAPAATFSLAATPGATGQAVIDYPGGYNSATPGRLQRAGVGIAIRYVGAAKWKSLTHKEADGLRRAGIDVAAVYETKANWMLGGRKAGIAAAKNARAAVIKCGGPRRPFVYFACDVDTHNYAAVNACLKGAASVLGADHVGIYGGYDVCASALQSGYATKAWQTEAWSGGKILAQSALYQRAHRIDGSLGIDYDSNLSRAEDIGQWGYVAPAPMAWSGVATVTPGALAGIDLLDGSTGWAVGATGTLLSTSDGGASWKPRSVPTSQDLTAVRFTDASNGWAVGAAGVVLRTTDGGLNWTPQTVPTSATLTSVDFADANNGWIGGDAGTILHTTDGGATWSAQASHATARITSVRFADATNGWAVGDAGTILRTTNGGSTWGVQSAGALGTLGSVDVWDARTAWAVGEGGVVVKTINGGSTWTRQPTPTTSTLRAVRFTDFNTGRAVGAAGTILRTLNGGATWLAESSGTTATLSAVDSVGPGQSWAAGDGGVVVRGTAAAGTPFGSVVGSVIDAVTHAPVGGISVTVGSRLSAPTAPDGTFVAARIKPGTYSVSLSDPRYILRVNPGVTVTAGSRTVLRASVTPRTYTWLNRPSITTAYGLAGQPVTLTVTLLPSSAATAGVTTLQGWHYEQKSVTRKVKGKWRKVKIWYWRARFTLVMSPVDTAGHMLVQPVLAKGAWRVQARFAGSGRFLPYTSPTGSFSVN